MQQEKGLSFGNCYFSKRLKKKMKLLAVSKGAIFEAPSGYGKTTAIRDYLKNTVSDDNDVFWFSAVDDETQAVLYRRLCSEIGKIDSDTGEKLLKIDFPNAFTISEVCDTLRSIKCDRKTWFVIDDFQYLFAILPPLFINALFDIFREDLCIVIITQILGHDFQRTIAGLGILHITAADLKWSTDDIRCYFNLAGEELSVAEALEVEKITSGWIIAVHLQLFSYRDTGTFSDVAVLQLMEHLIWEKMSSEQKDFFLRVSVFESGTLKRLCGILNCETLPDFVMDSLSIPFIGFIPEQKLCVPHTLLREMVCLKRREQGKEFDNECLLKAGDLCRDDGELVEAVLFYTQIKNYQRVLELDLSPLVCMEIGDRTFNDIALEIASDCPEEIKTGYPHSMLCIAWAARFSENEEAFSRLMNELDSFLPGSGPLRAEWLLLSVYLSYPYLDKMLSAVQKAAEMFGEACSSVILPEVPWAFYEYMQLSTFHIRDGEADKEADLLEKFISTYSSLTGGHGSGADALFRAELAFYRCDTAQAEILAHKAVFLSESKKQKNIQIGAVRLLAVIALLKSDLPSWQRVVNDVEQAVFGPTQNTLVFRTMLDVVHGSLMAQLREYDRIADWLKKADFLSLQLPAAIFIKAVEIHGYYLMGKGEYTQLIGFLQSVPLDKYTPFPEHFHYFTIAVGYSSLGDTAKAAACLELSAKKALPDEMLHCFVGFSRLLDGLSDEFIKQNHPALFTRFQAYKTRYFSGWFTLHNAIAENELPNALTRREREIAELAAEGLRNNEIAKKLYLSEHTVRAHLRSIYQKLDIDRRAKLVNFLK